MESDAQPVNSADTLWTGRRLSGRLPQAASLDPESAQYLPDFLVISPPKTGSTWLAANLRCHSEIFIPDVKEVKYFSSYWQRLDLDWYLGHFRDGAGRLKGEASPSYSILPCRMIRLIHSLMPNLKLIFLMREPISRAWSHAKHTFCFQEANFEDYSGRFEAISDGKWRANFTHRWPLANGDYLGQLRRWLSVFPKNQVYVGFYESIQHDPQSLLGELFAFLGAGAKVDFAWFRLSEKIMEGLAGEIPPALKQPLQTIFQDRTRQLAEFLKDQFDLGLPPEWNEILQTTAKAAEVDCRADGLLAEAEAVFGRQFDDEYLADLVETETLSTPRVVYRGYNIVFYRGQFYALAQALGPFALEKTGEARLQELKSCGSCLLAGSLSEARERVDQWINATLKPILVEEGYRGFNIIAFSQEYYAIRSGDGGFEIETAKAGKYRELFHGDTLDGIKAEIDQAGPRPLPRSIEEGYRGFNIILFEDKYYAVPQGETAFAVEAVLSGEYTRSFHNNTLDGIKAEIDQAAPRPPQLIEEGYYGFNIISYQGAWYGLAQDEGALDAAKLEKHQYTHCFSGSALEDLKEILRTEAHIRAELSRATARRLPQLIEEGYYGFNIISYDGIWYGLAQEEGAFDPAKAREPRYAGCFSSTSEAGLKEILRTEAGIRAEIEKRAAHPLPQLIEEGYYGFNIISYDGIWYGLAQAEGAFDPAKVEKRQYDQCFPSASKEELKDILRNLDNNRLMTF